MSTSPTRLGNVLSVNLAENTAVPGEGKLLAAAYYTAGDEGSASFVSYTRHLSISSATLRRFPDLVNVKGDTFGVPSRIHPRTDGIYDEVVRWIDQWDLAGGYLAAWDVPALLERVAKYDRIVPERLLDLKVLHRALFPKYRGRRDLNSLAGLVGLRGETVGLVEEADLAGAVAETIIERIEVGDPSVERLGSTWEEIMAAQQRDYAYQWAGLCKWMEREGRDPSTLRSGWPTWGARVK